MRADGHERAAEAFKEKQEDEEGKEGNPRRLRSPNGQSANEKRKQRRARIITGQTKKMAHNIKLPV